MAEMPSIELGGRKIVPHSSRHSLASLLEAKSIFYDTYRNYWGSDLKTIKNCLYSTEKTIRNIEQKISKAREKKEAEQKVVEFKVS